MRLIFLVLLGFLGCTSEAVRGDSDAVAAENRPPEINIGELERAIHRGINAVRDEHALDFLDWDDDLAAIARDHSLDMAQTNSFSHSGSNGSTPSDRASLADYECMKEVGDYRYTGIAENIFMIYVYGSRRTYHGPTGTRHTYDWKTQDDIASDVVEGWMNSPGHRANILEARHDREGVGIVRAGDQLYITQNLC